MAVDRKKGKIQLAYIAQDSFNSLGNSLVSMNTIFVYVKTYMEMTTKHCKSFTSKHSCHLEHFQVLVEWLFWGFLGGRWEMVGSNCSCVFSLFD